MGTRIVTPRLLQRQGMDNEHIIYFMPLSIGAMIFTGHHPMTLELNSFQIDSDNFPNLLFSSKKSFHFETRKENLSRILKGL